MIPADVATDTSGTPRRLSSRRIAWLTFGVLFCMNLLDYTDRWVLAGMLPEVSMGLHLDPVQAGFLATWFLVSYSIIGPFMGFAGDRFRRTWLLAIGVGIWSLATIGSGLAQTYGQLSLARSLLGVGEAVNGVIAPTILMDLFPREQRSRVLSGFYLAMPLGGAIGLVTGSWVAKHYSWHIAFFVVATPGLLMAAAAALLPEPIRGQSEGVDAAKLKAHELAGAGKEDYIDLMVNSSFTYSVLGMSFYTFAIGGLAFWLPTFLIGSKGMESVNANAWLGAMTLFASVTGMGIGGWLSDRLARYSLRAHFLVPGFAMLGSIPFIILVIYAKTPTLIFAGVFFAEALMFINTGPCTAIIGNVVMPNMRAAAISVSIFAVHFLGDIWSPPFMGWMARTFGQRDAMESVFGRCLASIGAVPTVQDGAAPYNYTAGMLVVIPAVLLSGIVLLAGARHLPHEMALMLAKLKANPNHIHKPGGRSAALHSTQESRP